MSKSVDEHAAAIARDIVVAIVSRSPEKSFVIAEDAKKLGQSAATMYEEIFTKVKELI
jgi:hypothetical protein